MRKDSMKTREIKLLIEKYYEGLTSREEEMQIASYLEQNPNADGFEAERAMFAYFKTKKPNTQTIALFSKVNYLRTLAAVFVVAILSTAVFFIYQTNLTKTESYAYINGQKITDENQIAMFAQANLNKFSDNLNVENRELESFIKENSKIEKQLKLFSEIEN